MASLGGAGKSVAVVVGAGELDSATATLPRGRAVAERCARTVSG